MYILFKVAINNFLLRKKQTRSTLTSSMLCLCIFYSSLSLLSNIYNLSTYSDKSNGNYHYTIYSNQDLFFNSRYDVTYEMETDVKIASNENMYEVHTLISNNEISFFNIIGEFPKNKNELLVPSSFAETYGKNVTLNFYDSLNSIYSKQEFKIVGIYNNEKLNFDYFYGYFNPCAPYQFFIKDKMIQITSKTGLADLLNIPSNTIYENKELIIGETFNHYFDNNVLFIAIFLCIIFIDLITSFIAIKNTLVISTNDNRRQIGILKSVGATSKQIYFIIVIETLLYTFTSSLVGIIFGIGLSYGIFLLVNDILQITLDFSIFINFRLIFASVIVMFFLLLITSLIYNKNHINDLPVQNLSENKFSFPVKIKKSKFKQKFPWYLFVIYNHRLRSQTKNIRQSFLLLLICCQIFITIFLSNLSIVSSTPVHDYDIKITNNTFDGEYTTLYFDFIYSLYDKYNNGQIKLTYVSVERFSNKSVLTRTKMYDSDFINDQIANYPDIISQYDKAKIEWCNLPYNVILLDEIQFKKIASYVEQGNLDKNSDDSYIMIISEGNDGANYSARVSKASIKFKIAEYDLIYDDKNLAKFISENDLSNQNKEIGILAKLKLEKDEYNLPYQALYNLHFPLTNTDFIIAQSYLSLNDNRFYGSETIKIKLANPDLLYDFQNELDELMRQHGVTDKYDYEFGITEFNRAKSITFIIEMIFYPIISLLLLISLLNINNVLQGNITIKQYDLEILKAYGLTNSQIRKFLFYEYLEGYFSASIWLGLITVLISIIFVFCNISLSFDFTANIFAIYIATVMFMSPILLLFPCIYSFYTSKKIHSIK